MSPYLRCLDLEEMVPLSKASWLVPYHASENITNVVIFCVWRMLNDKKAVQCFQGNGWYHPACVSIPDWMIKSNRRWKWHLQGKEGWKISFILVCHYKPYHDHWNTIVCLYILLSCYHFNWLRLAVLVLISFSPQAKNLRNHEMKWQKRSSWKIILHLSKATTALRNDITSLL